MRNWMMSIVLACVFLAGCSNVANEGIEVPVIEKEAPVMEEEAPVHEENTPSEETKEAYVQKLDDVEAGLADLQHLQDEGTTVSMTEAVNETYKRWDVALNEIY